MTSPDKNNRSNDFVDTTVKVSSAGITGNIFLSFFKLMAGIIAHSDAMISDAIHSASDVFSSIIVIIGVKMSAKKADREHPYGHERFECVAALILAVVLLVTGLFIGHTASEQILSGNIENIAVPGRLALFAAIISIICKEAMYQYTKFYAKAIKSSALMADAWHHRSDALSSVGALIGIAGARLGHPVCDKIASIVICAFILKAAFDIFKDAVSKMVDSSCDPETEKRIETCALKQTGVLGVDMIQTRVFGNKIYVDIEICAEGSITLEAAHGIAENVHDAIETGFPDVKHVMVHVNPYRTKE